MKQSLEELEGKLGPPEFQSSLVLRCHAAHKKPIDDLTDLELATFLDQKIGTKWILPVAIKRVAENKADNTEYYDGQLQEAVEIAKKAQQSS